LAAIISLKIVLAVLDVMDDIPLLLPSFELIGIAYATWATFRYLLKASTRQELITKIRLLKEQFLGNQ
jgi:hypothetical protein